MHHIFKLTSPSLCERLIASSSSPSDMIIYCNIARIGNLRIRTVIIISLRFMENRRGSLATSISLAMVCTEYSYANSYDANAYTTKLVSDILSLLPIVWDVLVSIHCFAGDLIEAFRIFNNLSDSVLSFPMLHNARSPELRDILRNDDRGDSSTNISHKSDKSHK